ncbi:MAG TPA: nitronate monooxygenase [Dehalococcoidia bacterium]|jgi:nitronate monooxygenase|nr:nitronate monooxygenase [Dehalococcoidia bacterium]
MFQTRVTQLLDIEYPIIQGGMLWLSRAEFTAAVSNAGALGILSGLSFPTPEELRDEIRKLRHLTDKPFGVNIPLLPTLKQIDLSQYIRAALEEGVTIFETAGNNPSPYLEQMKAGGALVLHKTASLKHALHAQELGADIIAIMGFEGGGHPGMSEVTSLVLIPRAVDTLKVPVVAAGGFGDGRGLAAALALGAEAILMGTRFVATQECLAHPRLKEWMAQARETDTMIVERSLGFPLRVVKNQQARRVLEAEAQGLSLDQLAPLITGQLAKQAWETGEFDTALLACGQVVGLIQDIPTVKELIAGIVKEAQAVAQRLTGLGLPAAGGA